MRIIIFHTAYEHAQPAQKTRSKTPVYTRFLYIFSSERDKTFRKTSSEIDNIVERKQLKPENISSNSVSHGFYARVLNICVCIYEQIVKYYIFEIV